MKVALDVDGIIAGFYPAICDYGDMPYAVTNAWSLGWIRPLFKEIADDYHFWANLPVMEKPENINFDFDLYLTHCPQIEARQEWLDKNKFPKKLLIAEGDKAQYMVDNNIDILIDDKPQTVQDVLDKEKIIIQYFSPYLSRELVESEKVKHKGHPNYYYATSLLRAGEIVNELKNVRAYNNVSN